MLDLLPSFEDAAGILKKVLDIATALQKRAKDAGSNEALSRLVPELLRLKFLILELEQKYRDAQQVQRDLERKLLECEQWGTTAQQYELKAIAPGAVVQAPKPGVEGVGQADHWLCPDCFTQKKQCVLQFHEHTSNGPAYRCGGCGLRVVDRSNRQEALSICVPRGGLFRGY